MATTVAPLFGLDASGSLAKAIVFSKWRGRTYVRRHSVPANPKSGLQIGVRAAMRFNSQAYGSLSDAIKARWIALDAADNITGLDSMVRFNLPLNRQNFGMWSDPEASAGTTPDAPTLTATAQPKSVSIALVAGANAPEFGWQLYRSLADDITGDVSTQIRVLPAATLTFVDTGLTTGTEYFYEARGFNDNGEQGALSASDSATPT